MMASTSLGTNLNANQPQKNGPRLTARNAGAPLVVLGLHAKRGLPHLHLLHGANGRVGELSRNALEIPSRCGHTIATVRTSTERYNTPSSLQSPSLNARCRMKITIQRLWLSTCLRTVLFTATSATGELHVSAACEQGSVAAVSYFAALLGACCDSVLCTVLLA